MIKNKSDLKYYLEADKIALETKRKKDISEFIAGLFFPDHILNFQKLLRKTEYVKNCKHGLLGRTLYAYYLWKLQKVSLKLGFCIYPNNFGPGLSISHPGPIIINPAARIGSNCRIHPCVVIGTQAGRSEQVPKLGNNIYIGPGVKIFGSIEIADNIAIGANSVVNKSFMDAGITIAGVPARKISDQSSEGLTINATDELNSTGLGEFNGHRSRTK